MLYLTAPSNPRVRAAMRAGLCGAMLNPRDRKSCADLDGIPFALDNGRYGKWSEVRWRNALERYAPEAGRCLFAVVPDVVADAAGTLDAWHTYAPVARAAGYRLAYAAQDGYNPAHVPWAELEVLFVGGTTAWKLSEAAFAAARDARARGKRTHLGRVNSYRRYRHAAPYYNTADGTLLAYGPDANLERIRKWAPDLNALGQPLDL